MTDSAAFEKLAITTMRTLAMDAVQRADSGHPGTPMALAPVVHALWDGVLRFDPRDPEFFDRDRFILSCGHASMLLYSALHLHGYDLSLDDIKSFRQWESPCAGHPEYRHCPGVETTTGPLGQGCGNSVGMAMGLKWLGAKFNRPGHEIVTGKVWTLASDGDLMEGVAFEAACLAGHWGLDNLVWIYDQNRITIEGSTALAMSEDVAARFRAIGWQTWHVKDANDTAALRAAYASAAILEGSPKLIIVDSKIAWGAPTKEGTAEAHGAPLGVDEIKRTKAIYGWPEDAEFLVPDEVKSTLTKRAVERGAALRDDWKKRFAAWATAFPDLAADWRRWQDGELPAGWEATLPQFPADPKGIAGRKASGTALAATAQRMWWLIGGSADLGSSNLTMLAGEKSFSKSAPNGRNMHFGIREHGMASIANGMALVGLRPYVATFLMFHDYARPAHRLASMMRLPVIYVYTHDSIGLGEDGPTHQPIEHLASMRAIPGLTILRPGDANEAATMWRWVATVKDHPVALVLSRQNLRTYDRQKFASAEGVLRGAYVMADASPGNRPEVILMASGSELSIAVEAFERLAAKGVAARIVSFPSWELFARQDSAYRESVLPSDVRARVAVEAASSFGWERWVGLDGATVTRDDFGASAPPAVLFKKFGFTADNVCAVAEAVIVRNRAN